MSGIIEAGRLDDIEAKRLFLKIRALKDKRSTLTAAMPSMADISANPASLMSMMGKMEDMKSAVDLSQQIEKESDLLIGEFVSRLRDSHESGGDDD